MWEEVQLEAITMAARVISRVRFSVGGVCRVEVAVADVPALRAEAGDRSRPWSRFAASSRPGT